MDEYISRHPSDAIQLVVDSRPSIKASRQTIVSLYHLDTVGGVLCFSVRDAPLSHYDLGFLLGLAGLKHSSYLLVSVPTSVLTAPGPRGQRYVL
jgi:hypothetical protein